MIHCFTLVDGVNEKKTQNERKKKMRPEGRISIAKQCFLFLKGSQLAGAH